MRHDLQQIGGTRKPAAVGTPSRGRNSHAMYH
jgi:hypothetical protein